MNSLLLWIITGLYFIQCLIWLARGDNAAAMILFGYSIANLGLIAKAG